MNHEVLHNMMFWVGGMFALMPIVVAASVIGTTIYLRKKRAKAGSAR